MTHSIFPSAASIERLNREMVPDRLAGHLGITFTAMTQHTLTAELKISSIHSRPGGIMNGGTSLALIETVGSAAGACMVDPDRYGLVGIQVNANHLGQVMMGDTLIATAEPEHVGQTTHVWKVTIQSKLKKKKICVGSITLFVLSKDKIG